MSFLRTATALLVPAALAFSLSAFCTAQDISFSDGRDPAVVLQTVADTRVENSEAVTAEARRFWEIEQSVLDASEDWLGTPYRWGGDSRRGIDCSAFVRRIYRRAFDVELTRTTATQVQQGHYIRKNELKAGDLVFFRRGRTRHVGIYIRDGDFVHASSSGGVKLSNLSGDYYTRYYWTARRFDVDPTGNSTQRGYDINVDIPPTPRDRARNRISESERMLKNRGLPRSPEGPETERRIGW